MSGVQHIPVAKGDADQRLDRLLRRWFPQLSQGRIEKMCRKGELRLDGGRVKAATRVAAGQVVRVPPMPDAPGPAPERDRVSERDAEMIRAAVIYRDAHVIALNKPPGLASQGGSGQVRHVDGLAVALAEGGEAPRLVHRLDKDTSGVLLLGRTRAAAAALAEAFRHRATRKVYWAAVAGVPKPLHGEVRYGLVKAGGEAEKMRPVDPNALHETPGAKRALTEYRVIEPLARRAAWVAMQPITGRTHQLRAHMGAIGHPIVGDGKYGGSGQENLGDGWGAQLGGEVSRKLHLHARSLTLEHPMTGATLHLVAPLPDHMRRTWDGFGWDDRAAPVDPFDPEDLP
ncbi:MAG: RluA family pseudouridine synthase [Shimia sp.]